MKRARITIVGAGNVGATTAHWCAAAELGVEHQGHDEAEDRLQQDRDDGEPERVADRPPPDGIGENPGPLAVIVGDVVLEADELALREVGEVGVGEAVPDGAPERPGRDEG